MDVTDKNVLVAGLGKSGAAAAAFLRSRGAAVTVTDAAAESSLGAVAAEMRAMGVSLELGGHNPASFESADLIVISPGVPHTIAPVQRAAARGVPVIGEIELAWRFVREPIVAVTGTNGKTTVTLMVGEMLRHSGRRPFVGGNIGTPLIDYVRSGQTADTVVVEISSFQLDTIRTFRPGVGVLLNITEDHMDRYPDFAAYARSKARIFENQTSGDIAVLNGSDPIVRSACRGISGRRHVYGIDPMDRQPPEDGAHISGGAIRCRVAARSEAVFDLSRVKFTGRHNLENACAACLAALTAGGSATGIQAALNRFRTPAHRLELVATVRGVRYVNDSKATNVNAVSRALESFDSPVVLIMGGRDKGSRFNGLRDPLRRRVRKLILMGEAAPALAAALDGAAPMEIVADMDEAVMAAAGYARPGEVVLLSPGCSSFDRYDSYAERGHIFATAVKKRVGNA